MSNFNPQGSREPRRGACARTEQDDTDFNPQGSREPRHGFAAAKDYFNDFNPQGSREPRPFSATLYFSQSRISIHKALASLDLIKDGTCIVPDISIHKALASLDSWPPAADDNAVYFNPQGSREPRPTFADRKEAEIQFQSTRLSRAST